MKGELEGDCVALAVSRPGSRLLNSDEPRLPLSPVKDNFSTSSAAPPPSSDRLALFAGEGGGSEERDEEELEDAPVGGHPVSDVSDTTSDAASDEAEADHAEGPFKVVADKDAESAIMALLALQREPSPTADPSREPSPEGERRRRPASPGGLSLSRQGSICKPETASRFFCKFPKCGKAYASTDAVRKHCRQRHLDWLRRLGHGCPALYCRWED